MQNTARKCLYERRKSSYINLILNIIIVLFVIVLTGELIFNSIYTNIYVKGKSMEPTLIGADNAQSLVTEGGDYVFVNTHAAPDYLDIVVVQTENAHGTVYNVIKRVVAFGGDTVKIDRGRLWIKYKGESEFIQIDEPYVLEENNDPSLDINTFGEHVVEDGCMFLLGDNRDVSEDSRRRGDYPITSLVGVVPEWSLKYKSTITSIYTFFEFKLGFGRMGGTFYSFSH